MLRRVVPMIALALVAGLTVSAGWAAEKATSVLDFKMKNIDGQETDLAKYKGDVLLVVNVASKCGLTPQYEALEAAYEKYKGKGFQVLAFPANEFLKQEPGTDSEIKAFCTKEYGVTFPVFSKIVAKGEGIHPLYKYLTTETPATFQGPIAWNFTKFLVNRKGEVIARFEPKVTPDSEQVTKAIEAALAESK